MFACIYRSDAARHCYWAGELGDGGFDECETSHQSSGSFLSGTSSTQLLKKASTHRVAGIEAQRGFYEHT